MRSSLFYSRYLDAAAKNETASYHDLTLALWPGHNHCAIPIDLITRKPMGTQSRASLANTRHKRAYKQTASQLCYLHLSNAYGINRHAWYLLTSRLSFVSPDYFYSITPLLILQ